FTVGCSAEVPVVARGVVPDGISAVPFGCMPLLPALPSWVGAALGLAGLTVSACWFWRFCIEPDAPGMSFVAFGCMPLLPVLPSVVGAALMLDGLAVLPSLLWAPAIDMPAISAAAAVMVVSVFIVILLATRKCCGSLVANTRGQREPR